MERVKDNQLGNCLIASFQEALESGVEEIPETLDTAEKFITWVNRGSQDNYYQEASASLSLATLNYRVEEEIKNLPKLRLGNVQI